jgi:hypothetical protein
LGPFVSYEENELFEYGPRPLASGISLLVRITFVSKARFRSMIYLQL